MLLNLSSKRGWRQSQTKGLASKQTPIHSQLTTPTWLPKLVDTSKPINSTIKLEIPKETVKSSTTSRW